jgi:hypothetical protein
MVWIPNVHWRGLLRCHILCASAAYGRSLLRSGIMTRIHLTPGATVLSSARHDGLERILAGFAVIAQLFGASRPRRPGATPGVAGESPVRPVAARV